MNTMATNAQRNNGSGLRMSRRAFLRAAAATAGAGILAACGGATGGGQPTAGAGQPAAGGATSAPAQTGNAIELSHWYHQYGEEGTQQAAMRYAADYSKVKPNVKVNVVWKPGNYPEALSAALLGSDAPDVFESQLNRDFVTSGQVAPLDDLYTDVKSDFNDVGLRANTVDGKLYGVKMIDDMGMIYYRKSLADAAGVKPPTTLDELGAAIDKLTTGQVKGLFMGNDGGIGVMAEEILWSSGHGFLKDGKIDFNNDDAVAAFTKAQQFLKDHGGNILSGAPTDWWDPSALTGGLAAMQWVGLWAMPGIKKGIGDDFGVVPWPQIDTGKGTPSTFWGGWSQFVNAKGKNVDAAKAYAKWLWIDNKDIQKDWALSYGFHVPPRKSVAAEADPLKTGPAKEAVDIINKYGVPGNPSWTGAMRTAYTDAISNILKNGADPKAELASAATKVQAELDKQK
jgi:multiple sugar transport system substrate-binding protein